MGMGMLEAAGISRKPSNEDRFKAVVSNLSEMITYYLNRAADEQYAPGADPDRMDHLIADSKKRADKLRVIRQQVEDIYTGVL